MARGEPAARGKRGTGLALGVSFGVLCLLALFLVVWTTRGCDGAWRSSHPPPGSGEPFAGAEAALVALGSRGCLHTAGPASPGRSAATKAQVESWLDRHGYMGAEPAWSAPSPLPLRVVAAGLDGSCGLLAFAAEPASTITGHRGADGPLRAPCLPEVALVPVCDGEAAEVEGSGSVSARAYLLPGLGPEAVARAGMPLGVMLAHAEAETILRGLGWDPADEVVRESVPAGAAVRRGAPAAPTSGCIGWVAVADGLGEGSTTWAGRPIGGDSARSEAVLGLVACAPDPAASATETQLALTDLDGGGGTLWFRPYAPMVGPLAGADGDEGRPALGVASMRSVTAPPAPLPRAVAAANPSMP